MRFRLLTRFEGKLEQYHGNLERAAIELSKEWRTDKILRHLEALLVVADEKNSFLFSGNGDVISPDDGVLAIGSGGSYALAAARALMAHTNCRRARSRSRQCASPARFAFTATRTSWSKNCESQLRVGPPTFQINSTRCYLDAAWLFISQVKLKSRKFVWTS